MAREIRVFLTDDIDGSEATQTVEFSVAGTAYTIDLNDANAAKFEAALAPYVDKADRVRTGRRPASTRRSSASRSASGATAEIRAWARDNGFKISDRGRIPANVIAAYESAH